MPIVPRYDGDVAIRPYEPKTASDNALGAGKARQLGQVAAAFGDVGVVLDEKRREMAAAAAKEADLEASRRIDGLLHNPESGYLAMRGKAALDARPKFKDAFARVETDIVGGITDEMARSAAQRAIRARLDDARVRSSTHFRGERETYFNALGQARIEQAQIDIRNAPGDPAIWSRSISIIGREAEELGRRAGLPQETVALARSKAVSSVLAAEIERLAATDTARAEALLESDAIAAQLTPDDRDALTASIEPYVRARQTYATIDAIERGEIAPPSADLRPPPSTGAAYGYFGAEAATPETAAARARPWSDLDAAGVRLSRHYTNRELTGGHDDRPLFFTSAALRGLDEMSDALGSRPRIFSTYRHGIGSHRHQEGHAFDIDTSGLSRPEIEEMLRAARAAGAVSAGVYGPTEKPTSLHIDWDPDAAAVWGPSKTARDAPAWLVKLWTETTTPTTDVEVAELSGETLRDAPPTRREPPDRAAARSYAQQLERAQSISDPRLREGVEMELRRRYQDGERARAQAADAAEDRAYQAIESGEIGSVMQLDPADLRVLHAEGRTERVEKYLDLHIGREEAPTKDDLDAWNELYTLSKTSPTTFGKLDLRPYRSRLTDATYKTFREAQLTAKESPRLSPGSIMSGAVDDLLRSRGVHPPTSSTSEANNAAYIRATAVMSALVADETRRTGRPPDEQRVLELSRVMFREVANTHDETWWNSRPTVPLFELDRRDFEAEDPGVFERARAQLREMGLPATDGDVLTTLQRARMLSLGHEGR